RNILKVISMAILGILSCILLHNYKQGNERNEREKEKHRIDMDKKRKETYCDKVEITTINADGSTIKRTSYRCPEHHIGLSP
ncbi:MAG: hypothetical protein OXT67_01155, partial [Zetaproteobacteria bacterium]|nr:hypothetical protein [Zetaproteobacteria bacterium]